MTSQHSPDAAKNEADSNPIALVIWVVIATVALVIGIVLMAKFAVGAYGGRSLENDPAMKPEALAQRIGPVAKLQLEGAAEVAPAAPAPAAKVATVTPAPAAAGKPDGKKTYDTACMACHATGAANAPKLGDKAAWAPRIKAGADALYASALKGKGAMPPKGGNATLTDADVKAAVDYLVAGSK
jgi:cytochrome c5